MNKNSSRPPDRNGDKTDFVSDWKSTEPFADLADLRAKGKAPVDDPAQMLEGWQDRRRFEGAVYEAQVGDWNTVPAALLHLLGNHRRAVAKVVVPPGSHMDFKGVRQPDGWNGTGLLVGPNLLLTNHHVLNSPEVAAAATIEFDYEWPADQLFLDLATSEPPAVRFNLDPSRLFVTSPVTGRGLDFTFVWMSEDASKQFGTIKLERGSFMINPGEPVFVIHHPRGRLKEASLDDTELLGINSTCLLYAADTDRGSSGACVFNNRGRLVALHHAYKEQHDLTRDYPDALRKLKDGRNVTIANEGIKISAIALDLEHRISQGGPDARSAAEVLRQIEGSDTLTGVFGGLGRAVAADSDVQRVVELYGASDQDIDIGFWDLHWLGGAREPDKLYDVATAIADLNIDIWCLVQVPADAVNGIIAKLHEKFGEKFHHEFAEQDAHQLKFTTAVIWRASSVVVSRGRWHESLDGVWTRPVRVIDSSAPPAPVFAFVPALFHLRGINSPTEARANLVALNFRALGEDKLRRRVASKLLVHAIERTAGVGENHDWILGGDLEPPLDPRDLSILDKHNYKALAANDEVRGGAFSYLRSAQSPTDRIFITGDLTPVDDVQQCIHVVKDRTVDKFIRKLADNRPVVLRLSLGRSAARDSNVEASFRSIFGEAAPTEVPAHALERGDGSWASGLKSNGLTKVAFLRENREPFARLRREIRASLDRQYDSATLPLTEPDLWVIIFAEAGIRNGVVNPDAQHSLGERGLLPLPANVTFWNGPDAPRWDRRMPLERNLYHYALYLGQLKNKSVTSVGGRMLYRDLFRIPGIVESEERQAKLLAGVVHGYFVKANYGGTPVPYEHILVGYASDTPVDQILRGTRYVHAQTSIPANRERNIQAALAAYRGSRVS